MGSGVDSDVAIEQPLISQMFDDGPPLVSFEFFPPKDEAGDKQFWRALHAVEVTRPSFISITYGAGGTTRTRTVGLLRALQDRAPLTSLGHLTCVAASREAVRAVVKDYQDAGVRNILALRGDPPGDPGGTFVAHPQGMSRALDLVVMLKELGVPSVGVAAVPTTHPESSSLRHDAWVLAQKADAGADFAITQFFFDVTDYLRLVELTRSAGSDIPIIAGLMPVTSYAQLPRLSRLSGAQIPARLVDRLVAAGQDLREVRRVGTDFTAALGQELLDAGAPGLHFITLNQAATVLDIYRQLGLDRRKR